MPESLPFNLPVTAPFKPQRWFRIDHESGRVAFHDPATDQPPKETLDTAYQWLAENARWREGVRYLRRLGDSTTAATVLLHRHETPADLDGYEEQLPGNKAFGYEFINSSTRSENSYITRIINGKPLPESCNDFNERLLRGAVTANVSSFCFDIEAWHSDPIHDALLSPFNVILGETHTPATKKMSLRELKALYISAQGIREVFWLGRIGAGLKRVGVAPGDDFMVGVGSAHDRLPYMLASQGLTVNTVLLDDGARMSLAGRTFSSMVDAGSASIEHIDACHDDWNLAMWDRAK